MCDTRRCSAGRSSEARSPARFMFTRSPSGEPMTLEQRPDPSCWWRTCRLARPRAPRPIVCGRAGGLLYIRAERRGAAGGLSQQREYPHGPRVEQMPWLMFAVGKRNFPQIVLMNFASRPLGASGPESMLTSYSNKDRTV